ncbi:MAG TPA: lipoyl(octanoyl) transferase LipB [Gemmatimonadaceae bacterium]|jgi:lipoate-protein ligase B|nr:lipoyl(octanoyl) transferase LipB [Gemmatimonadaceae bacterium]
MPPDELWVEHLGLMPYADALDYQRAVARARISGEIAQDVLLLVEHPPVVTLGRGSKERHLLASPELLASRGIELFEVERGGDVTFHGPGQLVGYPIIDLKRHRRDLHWYLRTLEASLIDALAEFGIAAERNVGFTGVWTQGAGRKIASIGVHARDWVTWHGFALNVSTDLSYFDVMVPCGIEAVTMTSIARELSGNTPEMSRVEYAAIAALASAFALMPREVGRLLDDSRVTAEGRAAR